MSDHDPTYFEQRAAAQLELAQRACHPNAVKAHYVLAESYLKMVGEPYARHSSDQDKPRE
jgi:hypothetical protein